MSESDLFYNDVKFVYENGLMNGMTTNKFGPNNPLERGMLAAILYRYAEYKGYTITADDDVAVESSAWVGTYVQWVVSNGILPTDGTMAEAATRAQIAGAIRAFLEDVAK